MVSLGTPLSPSATRVMLLGSGELAKEVLIALQRLGVETIAVDRRVGHLDVEPAGQVGHQLIGDAVQGGVPLGVGDPAVGLRRRSARSPAAAHARTVGATGERRPVSSGRADAL